MTLDDIAKIDREFLRCEDVSPLLGVDPQSIRCQAQADPSKLGFPVVVHGRRVQIPKRAFIHFCKYGYMPEGTGDAGHTAGVC